MKNQIMLSEQDLLVAELVSCYEYFEIKDKMKEKVDQLNLSYKQKKNSLHEMSLEDAMYSNFQIILNTKAFSSFCKYLESVKKRMQFAKAMRIPCLILAIVFGVVCVASAIFWLYIFFNSARLDSYPQILESFMRLWFWIGLPVAIAGVLLFLLFFFVLFKPREEAEKNKDKIKAISGFLTNKSINFIRKNNNYRNQLIEFLKRQNPEIIQSLEKKRYEKNQQAKKELDDRNLPMIQNAYEIYNRYASSSYSDKIKHSLKIIPTFYFDKNAIKAMLFFYVTKRGTTITELVNLYEDEKFRNKLLKSINDNIEALQRISSSINDLTETMRTQLGTINNTIANSKISKDSQIYQYVDKVELINEGKSYYRDLTVCVDGQPVDVKIYG